MISQIVVKVCVLTVSREAAALRSGRKPTSRRCRRKLWSSMPQTRSRNRTMGALWSGQKQADMSGSVTLPSEIKIIKKRALSHLFCHFTEESGKPILFVTFVVDSIHKLIITLLPLLTTGILSGMLIMPTRSSVGTKERKMARILRASPLPLFISCVNEGQ